VVALKVLHKNSGTGIAEVLLPHVLSPSDTILHSLLGTNDRCYPTLLHGQVCFSGK